jgi:hypothetical protein
MLHINEETFVKIQEILVENLKFGIDIHKIDGYYSSKSNMKRYLL